MGIPIGTMIGVLVVHIIMHLIELGFGEPLARCLESANPMCGTPIEGFFQLGRREDSNFSNSTLGRLPVLGAIGSLWDFIKSAWELLKGAFQFNYAWLKGDMFFVRLALWLVQTVMALWTLWIVAFLAISAIARR